MRGNGRWTLIEMSSLKAAFSDKECLLIVFIQGLSGSLISDSI